MVIALMLVYMYAFIDRAFIALLVEPIRSDLHATDVQMGLLLGLGFASFYCVINLLAGYLADRINRRGMLAVASGTWGAMTVLGGFANSFTWLFTARAGVGSAEGVIAPTAYSLIRDAVPPKSRALAFSIYGLAPLIGTALALVGGGLLYGAFERRAVGAFVGLGLHPWQCTLIVVGLCGVPFSLLMFTFREPNRLSGAPATDALVRGFTDALKFLLAHARLYGPLLLFSASAAMLNLALSAWLPTAFGRAFDLRPDQVGPPIGMLTAGGGMLGLLVAGWLMNIAQRSGQNILIYGVIGVLGTAGGVALSLSSSNLTAAYGYLFGGFLFVGISFAVGAATLTAITPSDKIGRVSAVYLIVETLAGQTLGPLFVALASQHLLGGPASLPLALGTMVLVYAGIATLAAMVLKRALSRPEKGGLVAVRTGA